MVLKSSCFSEFSAVQCPIGTPALPHHLFCLYKKFSKLFLHSYFIFLQPSIHSKSVPRFQCQSVTCCLLVLVCVCLRFIVISTHFSVIGPNRQRFVPKLAPQHYAMLTSFCVWWRCVLDHLGDFLSFLLIFPLNSLNLQKRVPKRRRLETFFFEHIFLLRCGIRADTFFTLFSHKF